ncbi:hypothetical protein [Methylobacterium oxalidis]|uniref:hypothetical protein n=1 Tax=Methylobacterium oxalidis TaxID=944322 RepID=UPI00331584B7
MPNPLQPSVFSTALREMARIMFVFLTHLLVATSVIGLAWAVEHHLPAFFEISDPLLLGVVPLQAVTMSAAMFVAVAVILWAPFAALRAR